jgi:hypothetical protein
MTVLGTVVVSGSVTALSYGNDFECSDGFG